MQHVSILVLHINKTKYLTTFRSSQCQSEHQDLSLAAGVAKKLNLKGVGSFALSRDASSPVLAAFVPEGKGQPGFVGLWKALDLDKSPNLLPAFARRSFFRVRYVCHACCCDKACPPPSLRCLQPRKIKPRLTLPPLIISTL